MSWAWNGIKRSPLPPRQTRIRPMSKKRGAMQRWRRAVLEHVAERDGLGCWAQTVGLVHDCDGRLQGHELKSRAQYPGGELDATNVRLVCGEAHRWIHDHPIKAFELGLLHSARLEAHRDAD